MDAAQVGPLDIRTQFFTPDATVGYPFDARAVLRGHAPARLPHRHEALADIEEPGQIGLAAGVVNCALKC